MGEYSWDAHRRRRLRHHMYKRLRWAATLRIWRSCCSCCCLWSSRSPTDWLTECWKTLLMQFRFGICSICWPFMLTLASFFGFGSNDYVWISSWFYYLFFLSISSRLRTIRSIFSHPKKLNWIDSKIHRKSIAVNWRLRGGLSCHNIETQHKSMKESDRGQNFLVWEPE